MITKIYEYHVVEYGGLSTDIKPTDGVIDGAVLYEADTGKSYLFVKERNEWTERT